MSPKLERRWQRRTKYLSSCLPPHSFVPTATTLKWFMSYFPSRPDSQATLSPRQETPAASPASRHSISDPPHQEQSDHRSLHSQQSRPPPRTQPSQLQQRRPANHDDAEAGRPGAVGTSDKRPSIIQQGSILVRESIFVDIRNDSIAMAGEFVGTILFLILSLGVSPR